MQIQWSEVKYPATWVAIPKGSLGVAEYKGAQDSRSMHKNVVGKSTQIVFGSKDNPMVDMPCSVRYVEEGTSSFAYEIDIDHDLSATHRMLLIKRLGFIFPSDYGIVTSPKEWPPLMERLLGDGYATVYVSSQKVYVNVQNDRDVAIGMLHD